MIVAVICDVLGEETNGTTVAAMNLIRFLKSKGHEVRVVCADQNRKGEENFFVAPNLNLGKLLNAYVKKIGITLAKADEKVLRGAIEGCDVVHIMMPFMLGNKAVKIANELNIAVTAGFHMQAENFTCYVKLNHLKFLDKLVYKTIYKTLYSKVDKIHYPTEFIKDKFETSIKKQTPTCVISNGVHEYVKKKDVEKPENLKDKIVITTIGRYAREKSQDTLIKAVRYSKYKDKIQLILAGQGIKEKYYRKLAKKLPIQPIFKLFSREELVDVINYSDIYVHTAEMELEGIACLEAIACGKLTIVSDSKLSATRNFAIDELCVFKNRKPKDLAKVIDFWIENEKKKKEYEIRYLNGANKFNQTDCLNKMEEMLKEAISEKRKK